MVQNPSWSPLPLSQAAKDEIKQGIPDWETLFGPFDLCQCEHCGSVLSPAAYLVDTLRWLDERNSSVAGNSVKDILFIRRPDLGEVQLTCDNTNTPLPYVDLANEVLENAISAPVFNIEPINQTWINKLDTETIPPEFIDKFSQMGFEVPEHPIVSGLTTGKKWAITGQGLRYVLDKKPTSISVGFFPQTSWTAEELTANPEHMNVNAYKWLLSQVYPWQLPFNLWREETRSYLEHLGIHRFNLMQSFPHPKLADDPHNRNLIIAAEYLGLNTKELQIIIGIAPEKSWEFWGYKAETLNGVKWFNDLSPVNRFLEKSGLSYHELDQLQKLKFINSNGQIKIESSDPADELTCDISKLSVKGLKGNEEVLNRIHRFVRLWRRLGWTMRELDRAIVTLNQPTMAIEDFIIQLHHIQLLHTKLNLSIVTILSWYANIDTAPYQNEGLGKPKSLYEELFQNPTVTKLNPGDKDYFRLDPSRTELQEFSLGNVLNITDEAILPTVMGALGVDESDIDLMVHDANGDENNEIFNLKNLSKLYRKVSFATELDLSIQDLLQIKDLIGINPFVSDNNPTPSSAHTSDTLRFIEVVKKIKSSGFTVAELEYLLRNEQEKTSTVGLASDSISLILDEIRKGLHKIHIETTVVPDLDGELTKKKLALLKWDNALIEELISTIKGLPTYEAILGDIPQGLKFPLELMSKISYDDTAKKLLYSGVMTLGQKQILDGLSTDPFYLSAIKSLYDQPRTFVSKKMRAFELETYSTSLEPLPATFDFPNDLKNKIYYDLTEKKLRFVGAMTDSEKSMLLQLAKDSTLSDTAKQQFVAAINILFEAPNSFPLKADNIFLIEEQNKKDALLLFDSDPSSVFTIEQRFNYILLKLLPHLRESLSKALVKQKLAEVLNVKVKIMDELLTEWVNSPTHPGQKCVTEFLDRSFSESNPSVALDEATFVDQFSAFRLLEKIATIIRKFKISSKQLIWLFKEEYGPSVGWLNLNLLPVSEMAQSASFNDWERLFDLFELRNGLDNGESVLSNLFDLARKAGITKDLLLGKLSEDTGWKLDDLNFLVAVEGFDASFPGIGNNTNIVIPATYKDERALKQLKTCFAIMIRLGVSAQQCVAIANPDIGNSDPATVSEAIEISRSIKQAVKAKYESDQWLAIAKPLCDILREKKRSSLVAYLVTHPDLDPNKNPKWTDVNSLYAHYLIDVEMSPCHMTSRIKQANSSVQLFVQRCLMNLESDEVSADEQVDEKWKEWKWMKTYRVWEANRKVFLWPENWIEPELRDDKSMFFKELENELMQNDVTVDTAETAFLHYLEKLDEVTRLEICGIYHQLQFGRPKIPLPGEEQAIEQQEGKTKRLVDILHVFGHTRGTPRKYYYRQRVNSARWTPWEKVDLDIEGDHLIPVVRNRRLYLFWPIFTEHAREPKNDWPTLAAPDKYWKIQMAWSEYKGKKWSAKKVSEQALEDPNSESHPSIHRGEKEDYIFKVIDYDADLIVSVYKDRDKIAELVIKGCDWMLKLNVKIDGTDEVFQSTERTEIFPPSNHNEFSFNGIKPSSNDDRLWVSVFAADSRFQYTDNTPSEGSLNLPFAEPPLLNSNPSGSRLNMLIEHQKLQFDAGRQLFFLQDDRRTFLVSPVDSPVDSPANEFLADGGNANLGNSASIESKYYQRKEISF